MSPSLNFGSFTSPFRRAPIWTCLSHDIVSHELGHAILDSFRPQYVYSEEVDTGAIHESVGDMMSMFTALSHKPVVEHLYRESGGDMMNPNLASGLAEEFDIDLWGVSFPFLRSDLPVEGGENGEGGSEPVGARMLRMAKERFTRIHHRSLRAFRDGLVDAHGHLPSGEHALPFKIAKQSSGATRPVRHRCNLKEHLQGIAGKHASFPFDLD